MDIDKYFEQENYFLPWNSLTDEQLKKQREFQAELTKRTGMSFGEGCVVSPEAHIYEVCSMRLGNNVKLGSHALLRRLELEMGNDCTVNSYAVLHGKIKIGSFVSIAPAAKLFGENHNFERLDISFKSQGNSRKGIVIGDDVWIGANAVIVDGVKIGSHCIIGGGAVVTKDIPDYAVAAGNPARVIRDRRAALKNSPELEALIVDFGKTVKAQWRAAVQSCAWELKTGEIRPWCDAAEISAMFGEEPPFMNRDEYIKKLHSMEEDVHSYETVMSLGYSLKALGSRLNNPFCYVDGIDVSEYLSSLPWDKDPWDCGHNADILASAMYFNRVFFGKKIPEARLFGWLGCHINPRTGMWGKDKDGDFLLPVNGWYRTARGSYGQFGAFVPFAEKTIDTVLAHKNTVPKGNACYTLDVIYPLWLCGRQTDHRRSEGEVWAMEQVRRIAQSWRTGFGFELETDAVTLKGTEMWLSIMYNLCKYLGKEKLLGYEPKGVHELR